MKKTRLLALVTLIVFMITLLPITPVSAATLTKIAVSGYRQVYYVNEAFSLAGTIIETYDDGSLQYRNLNDAPAQISGFDSSKLAGSQTITVVYKGLTTTFKIAIVDDSIVGDYEVKAKMQSGEIANWGPYNGGYFAFEPDIGEDGGSAVKFVSEGSAGGMLIAEKGPFGSGNVTHPDGTVTTGFIGASGMAVRYKSTAATSIFFLLEYRVSKSPTRTSKSVSLPNTNGEWKTKYIPYALMQPDTNGQWIYNMRHVHNGTNFEPVVEIRISGKTGADNYCIVDTLRMLWFKQEMINSLEVKDYKKQYYQHYDSFDYSYGGLEATKGDSSVLINGVSANSKALSVAQGVPAGENTHIITSKDANNTTKDYTVTINSAADNNANLATFKPQQGGYLVPELNDTDTDYTLVIPNSIGTNKVKMPITVQHPGAAAYYAGKVTTQIEFALSNDQQFSLDVIAHDGTMKTYNFTVSKADEDNSNADLKNITFTNLILNEAFDPDTQDYTADVSNTTADTTITPFKDDLGAITEYSLDGETFTKIDWTKTVKIALAAGTTTNLQIRNTALDGTQKTYNFALTKNAPATNADSYLTALGSLALESPFIFNKYDYTATVKASAAVVRVKPTSIGGCPITVNGVTVGSGKDSAALPMAEGENTITIVTTSKDGLTTQTYTITVTRPALNSVDGDNSLFSLDFDKGELNEDFDKEVTDYTMTIPDAINMLRVTPLKSSAYTSITVNGKALTNNLYYDVPTTAASTTITVALTAQSGVVKNYKVVVTKTAQNDSDASLHNISITNGIVTKPTDAEPTVYNAIVSTDTKYLPLTVFASDSKATVTVNGQSVVNGTSILGLTLSPGANTLPIVIKAADGTQKDYTLNVTRIESSETNNNLLSLTPGQGKLVPDFSPDVTDYELLIPASVGKVSFTPVKQDALETYELIAFDDPRVTVSGFNNTVIKTLPITVKFLSTTNSFNVDIVEFLPPTLTGLEMSGPKSLYYLKDQYDFATGEIIAKYSDKPDEIVKLNDPNVKIEGFDSSELADDKVITVTYGGVSTTYTIDVEKFAPPDLESISLVGMKTAYKVGDPYSWTAGAIKLQYTGRTETRYLDDIYVTVSGFDSSTATEDQEITVEIGHKTATYLIHVIDTATLAEGELPLVRSVDAKISDGGKIGVWVWNGISATYIDGANEDGTSPALLLTGGTSGAGGAFAFDGGIAQNSLTHSDGVTTTGFIQAKAIKFKYKSTKAMNTTWQAEHRASSPKFNRTSGPVSLPSTDDVWTEKIIYLTEYDRLADKNTQWLYNMRTEHKTVAVADYEPIITLRFSVNFGTSYCVVGDFEVLWEETDAVNSIDSVTGVKETYFVGDKLDMSGTMDVNYAYTSARNVPLSRATITGFDSSAVTDTLPLTISYMGKTYVKNVKIIDAPEVTSIDIVDAKTTYQVGDTLDKSVGKAVIHWSNIPNTEVPLSSDDITITGFDSMNAELNKELTVTYRGFEKKFNYNVIQVESIVVHSSAKRTYSQGESFDYSRGYITATYTDGTKKNVQLNDQSVTIDGFDSSTPATDLPITVYYAGCETTYTVTINEDQLTGIKAESPKLSYIIGDEFDYSQGRIEVSHQSGNKNYVDFADSNVTFEGFDSSVAVPTQQITVKYQGFSATYNIEIKEPEITYTFEGFADDEGTIVNFGTASEVTATFKYYNPAQFILTPSAVSFIAAYSGDKLLIIKPIVFYEAENGDNYTSQTFTQSEIANADKIKIISFTDAFSGTQLFNTAQTIYR